MTTVNCSKSNSNNHEDDLLRKNDNAQNDTNAALQLEERPMVNEISVITSKITDKSETGKKKKTQPNMDNLIQGSDLPDMIEDPEFETQMKVLNNYRNSGSMYRAKKNYKKAEWAFKNGIQQAGGKPARSKEQLSNIFRVEVEFRLDKAR